MMPNFLGLFEKEIGQKIEIGCKLNYVKLKKHSYCNGLFYVSLKIECKSRNLLREETNKLSNLVFAQSFLL